MLFVVLTKGLTNTLIYAFVTSGLEVVLGMLLAVLLTSSVWFRGLMRSVVFGLVVALVDVWKGVGLATVI